MNSKTKSRKLLEKDFQAFVLKRLRAIPHSWWTKLNDRTTIGLPDIVGCIGGRMFAFELKTGSKLSKIQRVTLEKMAKSGAFAVEMNPDNFEFIYTYLLSRSEKVEENQERAFFLHFPASVASAKPRRRRFG